MHVAASEHCCFSRWKPFLPERDFNENCAQTIWTVTRNKEKCFHMEALDVFMITVTCVNLWEFSWVFHNYWARVNFLPCKDIQQSHLSSWRYELTAFRKVMGWEAGWGANKRRMCRQKGGDRPWQFHCNVCNF